MDWVKNPKSPTDKVKAASYKDLTTTWFAIVLCNIDRAFNRRFKDRVGLWEDTVANINVPLSHFIKEDRVWRSKAAVWTYIRDTEGVITPRSNSPTSSIPSSFWL